MNESKDEFRKPNDPPKQSDNPATADEDAELYSLVEKATNRLNELSKEHVFTAKCCFHLIEMMKIKPHLAQDVLNADKNVFKCFDLFNRMIQKHAADTETTQTSEIKKKCLVSELNKMTINETIAQIKETPNPAIVEPTTVVVKKSNRILYDMKEMNDEFLEQMHLVTHILRNHHNEIVICAMENKEKLTPTQKKLLDNTEKVISELGACFKECIKNFPSDPESKRSRKRKSIPATTRKEKYLAEEKKKYVEIIKFCTTDRLEPDEDDDLLSFYCPKTACFKIDRILRTYLHVSNRENQSNLNISFAERNDFRAVNEYSMEAYESLLSISLLLAYLDPSYNKNDGPYAEDHIMELILMDQFPEVHKTTDQIQEIAKLKEKEKNRRIRQQEDMFQSMAKTFSFLDIRVAKMRTSHKMAEFYFYFNRYCHYKWEDMDELFSTFRDTLSQMIKDVKKI